MATKSKDSEVWSDYFRVKNTVMDAFDSFTQHFGDLRIHRERRQKQMNKMYFFKLLQDLIKIKKIGFASYALTNCEYIDRYIYFDEMIDNTFKEVWKSEEPKEWNYRKIVNQEDRYKALEKISVLLDKDIKESKLYKVTIDVDNRLAITKSGSGQFG